jgi:TonB family protein
MSLRGLPLMSSAEVWRTWEGRVVDGKFPLRQWLGGSEHSAVFLTERPEQPTQKAAIKLILADAGDADRQLRRWHNAEQLSHPHLIRILQSGRCDLTLLYVVMEYAEEDLSQILPQRPLAPAEVTDLLPPLLDALSYLHGKGFVHSRIMPSNMLAVGDLLKLSTDQVTAPTETNPRRKRRDVYDSPETAAGIVSPACDLWSVGATLVTALTQNPPTAGETLESDPIVPTTIPEPFRGIARECLRLDPKRRCSIAEIQARMQPAARSVPAKPVAVPSAPHSVKKGPIAAALAVVVLVVGFFVFHTRGKSTPDHNSAPIEQPAPQTASAPAPPVRQKNDPAKKMVAARGEVVHQVIPEIPQSARNTISGTIKVVVRVEVDPTGKVTSTKLTLSGPSRYFANKAVQAAQGWEFSPLEGNGQPVASTWLLRFRFKRSGAQVAPERVAR